MTRRGAIATSMPVFGLRPTRSPLSRRMKLPKPEIFTFLPCGQRMAHVVQDALDQLRRFGARQAKPIVNDVRQVGAGQGPAESSSLLIRAMPRSAILCFSRRKPRPPTRHITFA